MHEVFAKKGVVYDPMGMGDVERKIEKISHKMIDLPQHIKDILKRYNSTFNKRGELPACIRGEIYKNIDRFSNNNKESNHYLRAQLELSCTLKVIENWEACELTDNSATELLAMCQPKILTESETKKIEQRKNIFSTQVESLMEQGIEYFTAAYAGFACVSAVNAVLYDIQPDILGIPEIESDPDDWTACFYASTSYCGGATWEEGVGDDLKRREFWEWFLNDAVPELWQM